LINPVKAFKDKVNVVETKYTKDGDEGEESTDHEKIPIKQCGPNAKDKHIADFYIDDEKTTLQANTWYKLVFYVKGKA